MRCCMVRYSGPIRATMTPTMLPSRTTAATMIHDNSTSARSAMTTPTTIMIGAPTIIARVRKTSICTCWTSLVVRVMSEGAPNWLSSRAEKLRARSKTASRTSRPNPMAVRAARYTATIWHRAWTAATPSMTAEWILT